MIPGILSLAAIWATVWLMLSLYKHGGISGLLRDRAERNVRRAARQRAAAKWWDDVSRWALPAWRHYEAEETAAVVGFRNVGV